MDPFPGYELRAPTPDDLEGVAGVLVADDLDDAGEIVLDEDFVRNRWSRVGFDLATDAWVFVDAARAVVAYGQAMRDEPNVVESWGIVHPAHRGRGLGSSLLDRIDARAGELLSGQHSSRFRHAINAGDRAAAMMLRARGLRPVRHFWHMGIDLHVPVEPGRPPAEIEIGGIEPNDDLPAIHAILVEAFADDWGFHVPKSFEAWVEEETGSPSYDPTLWLLATEAGQPAGVLTASVSKDVGWVDYLGVRMPYRGRGVGAALLHRTFAALSRRGLRRALVNVDAENTTSATALYERVGMRAVKRWDLWERSRS